MDPSKGPPEVVVVVLPGVNQKAVGVTPDYADNNKYTEMEVIWSSTTTSPNTQQQVTGQMQAPEPILYADVCYFVGIVFIFFGLILVVYAFVTRSR